MLTKPLPMLLTIYGAIHTTTQVADLTKPLSMLTKPLPMLLTIYGAIRTTSQVPDLKHVAELQAKAC